MLDHTGLIVSELDASKNFYSDLLSVIDYKIISEHDKWLGYGVSRATFWIGLKTNYLVTKSHIAFQTVHKDQVVKFYHRAIDLGAVGNGEPKFRNDFYQNYYGAFILDRDNHSIGVVLHSG